MKSIDTQDPCIYQNRKLVLLYISSEKPLEHEKRKSSLLECDLSTPSIFTHSERNTPIASKFVCVVSPVKYNQINIFRLYKFSI